MCYKNPLVAVEVGMTDHVGKGRVNGDTVFWIPSLEPGEFLQVIEKEREREEERGRERGRGGEGERDRECVCLHVCVCVCGLQREVIMNLCV